MSCYTLFYCLLDLSCECDVISLYFMCCCVNGSVCLVCCMFDSVCELFGEPIVLFPQLVHSIFQVSFIEKAEFPDRSLKVS